MTVTTKFWSQCGSSRFDPALAEPQAEPSALNFTGEGFYSGLLNVSASGTLVLNIESPRALRLWIAGALVLDESLFWRHYERRMWAAVAVPCEAGEVPFLVEAGPRSTWIKALDVSSPSRNREKVRSALAEKLPDQLKMTGTVAEGVEGPAVGLRFLPNQFRKDSVVYQQVRLTHAAGVSYERPSTNVWAPSEVPPEPLWLQTSVLPQQAQEITRQKDRAAGVRNFFVPVSNPQDAPAPLRKTGDPESRRVEPEIEVARTIELTVEGSRGKIELSMPAFESLGRQAPVHEYHKMEKPEMNRDCLPAPVLPSSRKHLVELYWYAWDMLYRLLRDVRPESGLPGMYCRTGLEIFPHHQFVWDSSFTAMCTAYGFRQYPAYSTLNLLYSRQFDGGYINREHDTRDGMPAAFEPDFSPNPPIMSVAEWAIANLTANKRRLQQVYPVLTDLHRWLTANRLLPNGVYWTTGLANGLDNSPSLGDGYPDLTAQMAHDAEMLANIARAIGKDDEADAWEAERKDIAAAMNEHLWSDSMGIFSTSLAGGGHNPNKVVTAFWPLWTGLVPDDKVEALAEHLLDPQSFWRHHPLPSLAADSPHFRPEGAYWLGSVWAPTTYATVKGFARSGRFDLARKAALRHADVLSEVLGSTGRLWENYSSEKSAPGSQSAYDYCWTALGPIALLFEVIIGIEADALNDRITWHLPEDPQGYGVERFPLGPATVDLHYFEFGNGRKQVRVVTDKRIELTTITADGEKKTHNCKVGTSWLDV